MPFTWSQNQRPWMAVPAATVQMYFVGHCGNLKEDRPALSRQKCSPGTLLPDGIRLMHADMHGVSKKHPRHFPM